MASKYMNCADWERAKRFGFPEPTNCARTKSTKKVCEECLKNRPMCAGPGRNGSGCTTKVLNDKNIKYCRECACEHPTKCTSLKEASSKLCKVHQEEQKTQLCVLCNKNPRKECSTFCASCFKTIPQCSFTGTNGTRCENRAVMKKNGSSSSLSTYFTLCSFHKCKTEGCPTLQNHLGNNFHLCAVCEDKRTHGLCRECKIQPRVQGYKTCVECHAIHVAEKAAQDQFQLVKNKKKQKNNKPQPSNNNANNTTNDGEHQTQAQVQPPSQSQPKPIPKKREWGADDDDEEEEEESQEKKEEKQSHKEKDRYWYNSTDDESENERDRTVSFFCEKCHKNMTSWNDSISGYHSYCDYCRCANLFECVRANRREQFPNMKSSEYLQKDYEKDEQFKERVSKMFYSNFRFYFCEDCKPCASPTCKRAAVILNGKQQEFCSLCYSKFDRELSSKCVGTCVIDSEGYCNFSTCTTGNRYTTNEQLYPKCDSCTIQEMKKQSAIQRRKTRVLNQQKDNQVNDDNNDDTTKDPQTSVPKAPLPSPIKITPKQCSPLQIPSQVDASSQVAHPSYASVIAKSLAATQPSSQPKDKLSDFPPMTTKKAKKKNQKKENQEQISSSASSSEASSTTVVSTTSSTSTTTTSTSTTATTNINNVITSIDIPGSTTPGTSISSTTTTTIEDEPLSVLTILQTKQESKQESTNRKPTYPIFLEKLTTATATLTSIIDTICDTSSYVTSHLVAPSTPPGLTSIANSRHLNTPSSPPLILPHPLPHPLPQPSQLQQPQPQPVPLLPTLSTSPPSSPPFSPSCSPSSSPRSLSIPSQSTPQSTPKANKVNKKETNKKNKAAIVAADEQTNLLYIPKKGFSFPTDGKTIYVSVVCAACGHPPTQCQPECKSPSYLVETKTNKTTMMNGKHNHQNNNQNNNHNEKKISHTTNHTTNHKNNQTTTAVTPTTSSTTKTVKKSQETLPIQPPSLSNKSSSSSSTKHRPITTRSNSLASHGYQHPPPPPHINPYLFTPFAQQPSQPTTTTPHLTPQHLTPQHLAQLTSYPSPYHLPHGSPIAYQPYYYPGSPNGEDVYMFHQLQELQYPPDWNYPDLQKQQQQQQHPHSKK